MKKLMMLLLLGLMLMSFTGCVSTQKISKLSDITIENGFKMYEAGINFAQDKTLEIEKFKFQKLKELKYLININNSEILVESIITFSNHTIKNKLTIHKEDFEEVCFIMNDLVDKDMFYGITFDDLSNLNLNEVKKFSNDVEVTLLSYDKENEIIETDVNVVF